MSKLTRADAEEILRQVKENHARLEGCVRPHDFQPKEQVVLPGIPGHQHSFGTDGQPTCGCKFPASILFRRYICTKCRGEIEAGNHAWYQRGLTDGILI
jgi:hypothetical protein